MRITGSKVAMMVFLMAVLVFSLMFAYSLQFAADEKKNRIDTAVSGGALSLVSPVIAQGEVSGTTFLDREAGICAYTNIGASINLAEARKAYRVIERESSDYIIGSIALPNLPDSEDVHCFVHKDGWIIVYYLKSEPVSKIIDWQYWLGSGFTKNKLQVGLELMASALKTKISDIKYYHYQYPSANKLMIVADTFVGSGEDMFKITVPYEINLYEVSWSHYDEYLSYYSSSCFLIIDGKTISEIIGTHYNPITRYGFLNEFSKGITHIVNIRCSDGGGKLRGGCIVLVYWEP
ncbi:MAG: hypothetical protein QXT67_08425 [Candidatus Bathyarchaeia archaeon]